MRTVHFVLQWSTICILCVGLLSLPQRERRMLAPGQVLATSCLMYSVYSPFLIVSPRPLGSAFFHGRSLQTWPPYPHLVMRHYGHPPVTAPPKVGKGQPASDWWLMGFREFSSDPSKQLSASSAVQYIYCVYI